MQQYFRLSGWMLATLVITACGQATPEAAAPPIRPVKLLQISAQNAEHIRQFPALIEPTENARLTFQVSGRLTELAVRPGQQVAKGQLLAHLDATDYQLKTDQTKARYQLAKAQFERAEKLIKERLVSQSMFDEARAQLQIAEADLKTSETNLGYTAMKAPFAGTVARLLVDNHENIAAQQPILELQLRDMVDVVIQVPEDVIALVKKDVQYQPTVVFDSYPAHQYKAFLKEWDTRADAATNSFKVVFSMPTPTEFNVLSGMTANVLANLSQFTHVAEQGLQIPLTALFAANTEEINSNNRYVWVYLPESGTVEQRQIEIGALNGDGVAVIAGLQPGEQIVTAGVQQLQAGQQVRPWQRERGL